MSDEKPDNPFLKRIGSIRMSDQQSETAKKLWKAFESIATLATVCASDRSGTYQEEMQTEWDIQRVRAFITAAEAQSAELAALRDREQRMEVVCYIPCDLCGLTSRYALKVSDLIAEGGFSMTCWHCDDHKHLGEVEIEITAARALQAEAEAGE